MHESEKDKVFQFFWLVQYQCQMRAPHVSVIYVKPYFLSLIFHKLRSEAPMVLPQFSLKHKATAWHIKTFQNGKQPHLEYYVKGSSV